jgi:hypothetical protein
MTKGVARQVVPLMDVARSLSVPPCVACADGVNEHRNLRSPRRQVNQRSVRALVRATLG